MLQLTQAASTVFRAILDQPDVEATAIRLAPTGEPGDGLSITVELVDRPAPTDAQAEAEGVTVMVAPELAPALDDAILDARESGEGADLFLRAKEQ